MSVETTESIYRLIPEVPPLQLKAPRHKSKFNSMVKLETQPCGVMVLQVTECFYVHFDEEESAIIKYYVSHLKGPAKVKLNSPQKFLQKHSKEPKLPEKSAFQYPDAGSRRPCVPTHTERPFIGERTSRNFITTNAVNTIMSIPRKPPPKYVDTVTGTQHQLEHSGLIPKYTKKKDYGQTPNYLEKHKSDMMEAQLEYDRYVEESLQQGQMQQVVETERVELLEGLKKNWEELHHQYQGLSVITDTASKRARKERMEAEMKQLERDIDLIERHKVLYIAQEHQ